MHDSFHFQMEVELFDPMFFEYCRRMARITGHSSTAIAAAGYGRSGGTLRW
jgi:hypothetical protein